MGMFETMVFTPKHVFGSPVINMLLFILSCQCKMLTAVVVVVLYTHFVVMQVECK